MNTVSDSNARLRSRAFVLPRAEDGSDLGYELAECARPFTRRVPHLVGSEDGDKSADGVEKGLEEERALRFIASDVDDEAAGCPRVGRQAVHQRRLADAGLADDEDKGGLAGGGSGPRLSQPGQFGVAADEFLTP
jgi:hypothetical protein